MGNKNHKLPDRLVKGGQKKSQEARVPVAKGGGGNISSNLNIRWTRRKATIAATVLGVPFLIATVLSFKAGNILIGIILVGVAVFVGLMYWALRYIEENEF